MAGPRPRLPRKVVVGALAIVVALIGACSSDDDEQGGNPSAPEPGTAADQRHPDIVEVSAERDQTGTYTFHVTVSSPYDTPERYADGWRVIGSDGTVYGEHQLGHDHASEQPFTRTQQGVEIPGSVDEVAVEGRDQKYGYGGDTVTVELPPEPTQ